MHDYQMSRKIQNEAYKNDPVDLQTEYYPGLIMTSIHLADYCDEKDDKRRFQDYKGTAGSRGKDLKKNQFKNPRHNVNRIIAIG